MRAGVQEVQFLLLIRRSYDEIYNLQWHKAASTEYDGAGMPAPKTDVLRWFPSATYAAIDACMSIFASYLNEKCDSLQNLT